MYAEQIRTSKVPANMFSGYVNVLVFLFRLEYSRGKKARCSKTCTGVRYSFQRLRRCIEYVCPACALNVHINKTRSGYSALSIECLAIRGRIDVTNFGDCAIFDENRRSFCLIWNIEQSAIGYKKSLYHITCDGNQVVG